ADVMLQRLGRAPATCWSAECELRSCLERLRAGRRDLPARLEACRRLLVDLRDHGGVTPRRLADWSLRLEGLEAEGEDGALYREVSVAADAPAAPPALGLLALWLQPAGGAPLPRPAVENPALPSALK